MRFLPLAGVFLLAAIVVWRSWFQAHRYGTSGVFVFRSGSLGQNVRDGLGVALLVLMAGQAVLAAGWPEALALSEADRRAAAPLRHAAGAVLSFGGLLLLLAAQLDLGASWRIGIDEGARPGLVTKRLYGFCRNPIFLAMLVILGGYTLLLPTLLSAAMLAGAYAGLRLQIAAEEEYLSRTYGEEWQLYARRVGRLLPGIGKLP